jgi:hypothetical protein
LVRLQDSLGDHQDAIATAAFLRTLPSATTQDGFAYGVLYSFELRRARAARRRALEKARGGRGRAA